MRHTARVLVAVHSTSAAANLVFAALWSSRVLVITGMGWLLIALLVSAHHDRDGHGQVAPEAGREPAEPIAGRPFRLPVVGEP
ncbi:hypothetical protein [Saccharothrix longispora]|uniref:hypothetical protein n=1 Tax=Saccharothrix longispora TaxID=33920 RepID=UPI0028FD6BFF|nr:hypothetical protein [Saccharothrix longispora]MDU0291160.1 hypothetical protein [Saccharothrix longispora]